MFLDWNTNSWASYPTANMSGVPLLECPRSRRPSAPAHLRWRDCIQTAPYTVVSLVLWRVKRTLSERSKCRVLHAPLKRATLSCNELFVSPRSFTVRQRHNSLKKKKGKWIIQEVGRKLLLIRWPHGRQVTHPTEQAKPLWFETKIWNVCEHVFWKG